MPLYTVALVLGLCTALWPVRPDYPANSGWRMAGMVNAIVNAFLIGLRFW